MHYSNFHMILCLFWIVCSITCHKWRPKPFTEKCRTYSSFLLPAFQLKLWQNTGCPIIQVSYMTGSIVRSIHVECSYGGGPQSIFMYVCSFTRCKTYSILWVCSICSQFAISMHISVTMPPFATVCIIHHTRSKNSSDSGLYGTYSSIYLLYQLLHYSIPRPYITSVSLEFNRSCR